MRIPFSTRSKKNKMQKQNHNIHSSTSIWLKNINIKNFTNDIIFW